jgi:hypothetical protein
MTVPVAGTATGSEPQVDMPAGIPPCCRSPHPQPAPPDGDPQPPTAANTEREGAR